MKNTKESGMVLIISLSFIKIVNSEGDTLSCLGAHFERTYKVTPFKRVLLYFNGVSEGEDVRLVYNDKLYKKGIMDFNLGNKPVKL